jgi:hypothetical protein
MPEVVLVRPQKTPVTVFSLWLSDLQILLEELGPPEALAG